MEELAHQTLLWNLPLGRLWFHSVVVIEMVQVLLCFGFVLVFSLCPKARSGFKATLSCELLKPSPANCHCPSLPVYGVGKPLVFCFLLFQTQAWV